MQDAASAPPLPAPSPPGAVPHVGPGLSAEQFAQLARARQASAKVRRAVAVATFDAWATAVFAGLTLLAAPFGGAAALAVGLALAVVAYVSFMGVAGLRQLDPLAARSLAFNQIFLAGVLLAYAGYSLGRLHRDPGLLVSALVSSPEVAQQLGIDVAKLVRLVGWAVYGTVAAVAVSVQGGAAVYYFTRRKHVDRYVRQTPKWILGAQRAGLPM